ncbi:NF038120 family PEP-CTERM protein [Massilia sp. ST3]|uniref:NF038120 family PEP-CTERM protein n=1 Tax=Massilia sp. ST3 TaxID=2824903 RepID=UPI001B83B972|nr:NF038120 family PEP-CTERM protein [Massilia sp. ST3]MBQ5950303.1 PEP-CTERM sorting domain-containing protein [Massilia sp. ST3]
MIRKSHFAATSPSVTFKQLAAAALGAAAFAAAPAQAGVIGFDGWYGPVAGTEVYTESGFNLGFYANVAGGGAGALVGEFIDGSDPTYCVSMACPVNNPGMYYGAFNDSYIDITSSTNGQRFNIKSIDASFIGASPVLSSYPAVAGFLRIQGFRADGSSALQDVIFGKPAAGGFQFGHYNMTAAFAANEFVEALLFGFVCDSAGQCKAFQTNQGQFGVDNIELTAVPEPASALIFGLGIAGLVAARRRKAA